MPIPPANLLLQSGDKLLLQTADGALTEGYVTLAKPSTRLFSDRVMGQTIFGGETVGGVPILRIEQPALFVSPFTVSDTAWIVYALSSSNGIFEVGWGLVRNTPYPVTLWRRKILYPPSGTPVTITAGTLTFVWADEPAWVHNFVGLEASHLSDTAVPDSVWTAIPYNNALADTEGYLPGGVSPAAMPATYTYGYYHLSACVTFAANGTGIRGLRLVRADATGDVILASCMTPAISGSNHLLAVQTVALLAEDDYNAPHRIRMEAYQNSGGSLNVLAVSSQSPQVSLAYLGPTG